jgi:hypothetical protein
MNNNTNILGARLLSKFLNDRPKNQAARSGDEPNPVTGLYSSERTVTLLYKSNKQAYRRAPSLQPESRKVKLNLVASQARPFGLSQKQ